MEKQSLGIRAEFEGSPQNSRYRASCEFSILQPIICRLLRRRLYLKRYILKIVQAPTHDDKMKRVKSCESMFGMMEEEIFISHLNFLNFLLVRIWGTGTPNEIVEH